MSIVLAACTHASLGARAVTGESPATEAPPPAAIEPAPAAESPTAPAPQPAASPSVTEPEGGAANVATPAAAPSESVPSASSQSGAASAKPRPAKQATAPKTAAVSPAPAPAAAVAAATAAALPPSKAAGPPPLDLKGLEQRLRDTRAIGLFTKLSLKNQVDDLLAQFKAFHQGQPGLTVAQLRQKYELLLMKVVTLLQDGDPALASAVSSSREAIWEVLTDPQKFAAIGYST